MMPRVREVSEILLTLQRESHSYFQIYIHIYRERVLGHLFRGVITSGSTSQHMVTST